MSGCYTCGNKSVHHIPRKKGQKSYDHLSRHIKKYDLTKSNKLSDKNTYPRISIKKKPTLILYLMVKN